MNNAGLSLREISIELGLKEDLIKEYIEGPLKEDVEMEKLDLGNGKYHPYVIDLIIIQREIDRGANQLELGLKSIRERKK